METTGNIAKRLIKEYETACDEHAAVARDAEFGSFQHGQCFFQDALLTIPNPRRVIWEFRNQVFRSMVRDGVDKERAWKCVNELCCNELVHSIYVARYKCEQELLCLFRDWNISAHDFSKSFMQLPKETQLRICDRVWNHALSLLGKNGAIPVLYGFENLLAVADDVIAGQMP